jgi:hypothetical protein
MALPASTVLVRTEAEVISIVPNGSQQDLETEKARTILLNSTAVPGQTHPNTRLLISTINNYLILTMMIVPGIQAMGIWKTCKLSRVQTLKMSRTCLRLPEILARQQLQRRKAVNLALHSSQRRILRLLRNLFPI